MQFLVELPWPWSLTPAEALNQLAQGYFPTVLGRIAVGILVGLIAAVVTRRGKSLLGLPAAIMAVVGWLTAGLPLPILALIIVVYVTVATYRGASGSRRSTWRLAVVLGLRILALLLTFLTIARPTLMVRSESKEPSVLILVIDHSQSMTFKDEYNNQTRFEALRATLDRCGDIFKKLQDENQISIVMLGFAGDVADWNDSVLPDGKSSDYGTAINTAYARFGTQPNLRGMLVIGDGADNGRRYNAILEARRFKAIQCPVNSFVLGNSSNGLQQKDIAITNLTVEPSPVYVKGRMTIKAMVDAFGFEKAQIEPTIFIDGKPANIEKITVNGTDYLTPTPLLTSGNDVRIETTAPEFPGEIRVTLKIKPLPGETITANNESSTFVTVSKEGVSVLLIAPADEETKFIRRVLMADPRIRLFETTRQTDAPPQGNEAELFQFDRQNYDVIILRNVSARRMRAADPKVLERINELVKRKGVGFMMMGGFDSFGGSPDLAGSGDWGGTPIEELLPVALDRNGQISSEELNQSIGLYPTLGVGTTHYLLQLAPNEAASLKLWSDLNDKINLRGINRLGTPKPGASLLATAEANKRDYPILVSQHVGKGRTLAFAGDTTYLWRILNLPKSTEGVDIHARFWKQTVLWLAQQENSEGNVWVKPDLRRLAAGAPEGFSVGVTGKNGIERPGGRYEAKVIGPDGSTMPVQIQREGQSDRGKYWRTLQPGEYRIEVSGEAVDEDQKKVSGKASVRFLVYQDDREMLQPAADSDFLGKVAAAGGGRPSAYRIDDLPTFLERLKDTPLPNSKVKVDRYPDWQSTKLSPFLPLWLTLFVVVLCAEWGLRRMWGMV
jgi:uncharacterized membrane protein